MNTMPCVMLHFAELTQHEADAMGISRPASPGGTSDIRGVIDIPEASHGTEMNVVGAGMETRHNLRPTTTVCGPLGTGCAVTSL